jgi:malate dehydrogenase
MKKVSIIGAGNVGATTAYYLAKGNLCEVVLVDVVPDLPQAKARDFRHAGLGEGFEVPVTGTNEYADIAGSDVVVHTAGIPRKPGMDRMDLLRTNVSIASTAARAIRTYAPDAVVIAVANPLDVISMALYRGTGFSRERVIGMAGVLDATRFRYFLAESLGVIPEDVHAMVLGGHGDSMVPLPRYSSVGGVPVTGLLDTETIQKLTDRTRTGGGEIVAYLKTGSAFYAPGASTAQMVEAVLRDRKQLVPASAYLQGEYGYTDIFLGVPVVIGASGVEKIIRLELNPDEKRALDASADAVRNGVRTLESITADGES